MPSIPVVVRVLAAWGVVAAGALTGIAPIHADERSVLADGPVVLFDTGAAIDGRPEISVTADGATVDPEAVSLEIDGDLARTELPDELPPEYDDVLEPGATVFQVPRVLTPGLPRLGWSTTRLPPSDDGSVPSMSLAVEVEGPGSLVVYDTDDDGGLVPYIDTGDGRPDEFVLPGGSSGWPVWVFEEPGGYVIDVVPTLTRADGTQIDGPAARYHVDVTAPAGVEEPVDRPPDGGEEVPDQGPDPAQDESAETRPSPPRDSRTGMRFQDTECAVPGLVADAETVTDGHFDYGVLVRDGALRPRIKDDRTDPATWRGPNTVLFSLGETAKMRVPDAAAYSFLGEPGDPVWTIGQTQQDGVPWLGWNTQHPSALVNIDGPTTWRLDSVDGPGDLFIFQTGSFGELARVMSLSNGWPRSTQIPANTHAHGNWSFTEPGVYRITTTHTATLQSGKKASSQGLLYVQVGPCADADNPDHDPNGQGSNDDDAPEDDAPHNDASNDDNSPNGDPAPEVTPTTPTTTPSTETDYCTPPAEDSRDPDDEAAASPSGDQPANQDSVSEGHFDFGAEIVDRDLVARVKDDRTQPPSWVAPESFRFVLGAAAEQRVPSDPTYAFLGEAGDPIWLIPQTQVSDVPWLGWNTQHETMRSQVRGPVEFTLDEVSGPGGLAVYLTDSFGGVGEKVFGSISGFPKSFDVPLNVHAHGSWVFTAAGDYEVTMTQSATLTDDTRVSDQATLSFTVGTEAPAGAPGSSTAAASGERPLAFGSAVATSQDGDSSGDDCVLADTGASKALTMALPLGLTLLAAGCGALLLSRRQVAVDRG